MNINVVEQFPFPAELVFSTFRDRIQEYVRYTPNITDIKIKAREVVDEKTLTMQCDWGGLGQIPAAIRNILKPEMIRWEDWQTWDSDKLTCDWIIKPFTFRDFVTCEGQWQFEPIAPDRARVACIGVFIVRINHFPPFPDFLCRKASPIIEQMIGSYIPSNMHATFRAVKKFIELDIAKNK
jgi:hypothetical protein